MPQAGQLSPRTFISRSLGTEKSKITEPTDSVSSEGLLPGSLPAMFSHGRRDWGALWGPFCTDTNPVHEGSTLTI